VQARKCLWVNDLWTNTAFANEAHQQEGWRGNNIGINVFAANPWFHVKRSLAAN
jgi:hypothetical protein